MRSTAPIVRTEPLILVEGILERHENGGGAINLLAKKITRLTPNNDGRPATSRSCEPARSRPPAAMTSPSPRRPS